MQTNIVKNYINIDAAIETILGIYKKSIEEWKGTDDDIPESFFDDNYPDDYLIECAAEIAFQLNDDMRRYLNMNEHRIDGNFNNIDYDYPRHINGGELKYDPPLVKAMIDRLNAGEESQQADDDRAFLTMWLWETFGTWAIGYNFDEEVGEAICEYQREMEKAS